MASPITWSAFSAAWAGLACRECGAQISEGQPYLVRSLGRRSARFWCCACKAHLDEARLNDQFTAAA